MRRLVNLKPGRLGNLYLGVLPFALILIVYLAGSAARHHDNPNDKLLPSFSTMATTSERLAFEPDLRTGEYLLWSDTGTSLARLGVGLGISTLIGLCFGIATGLIPLITASLAPVIRVICLVPPMAILPVLFVVFGLDELSKIVLIVIGTAPYMIRDLSFKVQELPAEQLIKAQTLGASTWQIVLRIVLPQVMPRLIQALRLSLGPAWLFLISAEAIAATDGLGFRIFLMRRYLAMDVILPYVAWITLLAFGFDYFLHRLSNSAFSWARSEA